MSRLLTFGLAACGVAAAQQMPGALVDAGGYRVHLNCTGTGSPAVMLIGGFSFDWARVQPEIAKMTRVCSYDASGDAWSDPGPAPTCANRAREIHSVLHNGKVDGPYVLVGFSAGALFTRIYARDYPEEVAAVVLVDHAYLPPTRRVRPVTSGPDSPPALLIATPIEIGIEDEPGIDKFPADARALQKWAMANHPLLPTPALAGECIAQLAGSTLGDTPLVVVSTKNDAPGYAPLQEALLALSSRSSHLFADRSFHSIEISQPEIVVKAVRMAIEAVQ